MWPFSSTPSVPAQLPDLKRVPVDPRFAEIWKDYDARSSKEKLALALEGGGAKGRNQIGWIARMAEIGLIQRISLGAGTSVGGLNMTLTAKFLKSATMQEVVDIWRGIRQNSDVYNGTMPSDVWSGLKTALSGKLSGKSLLDPMPLYALVNKHLDRITSFDVPIYTITTEYLSGMQRVLGPGTPAVDQALSTSAVPGAFPAYQGLYMDGGMTENCPAPLLLELGATKIAIVYCGEAPEKSAPQAGPPTTLTTIESALNAFSLAQSLRTYNVLNDMTELRKAKGQDPIEVLHCYPSGPTPSILQFGDMPEAMQHGYDQAVAFITPEKLAEFLQA
jgi:predicted acylesterase/phospholipase RssA